MEVINMIVGQIKNDPRFRNNSVMQNAFRMYDANDTNGLDQLTENAFNTQGKDINAYRAQLSNALQRYVR